MLGSKCIIGQIRFQDTFAPPTSPAAIERLRAQETSVKNILCWTLLFSYCYFIQGCRLSKVSWVHPPDSAGRKLADFPGRILRFMTKSLYNGVPITSELSWRTSHQFRPWESYTWKLARDFSPKQEKDCWESYRRPSKEVLWRVGFWTLTQQTRWWKWFKTECKI